MLSVVRVNPIGSERQRLVWYVSNRKTALPRARFFIYKNWCFRLPLIYSPPTSIRGRSTIALSSDSSKSGKRRVAGDSNFGEKQKWKTLGMVWGANPRSSSKAIPRNLPFLTWAATWARRIENSDCSLTSTLRVLLQGIPP